MKKKLGVIAFIGTAMILVLFFLPCGMSLLIKDSNGHVYYTRQVQPGDTVSIGFKHSVEKVLVVDTFIVTDECMLFLKNTTYGSMGAGLPSDKSYNITSDGHGNFSIEDIDVTYEKINFMTVTFTNHYLVVSGETIQLSGIAPHEKPLILCVERNNPINRIVNSIKALI